MIQAWLARWGIFISGCLCVLVISNGFSYRSGYQRANQIHAVAEVKEQFRQAEVVRKSLDADRKLEMDHEREMAALEARIAAYEAVPRAACPLTAKDVEAMQ